MKQLGKIFLVLTTALILALPAAAAETLFMATTTSTDNTGLLDYLAPHFQNDTGIELKWTATGTGKALKLGQNCDADVLLVHAPPAELNYVKDGFGIDRREVMYNDFVIIGPASDSARIKGKSVTEALKAIQGKKATFASRGDNSGTNKKEILLWKESGIPVPDKEAWYVQTGQGMLTTINIAAERNAYTMTDRGTYIKYEHTNGGNSPLVILVEGDTVLKNQYSILAINPANCNKAKYTLATELSKWMAGNTAQKLIADFKLLGKQLFIPNAK